MDKYRRMGKLFMDKESPIDEIRIHLLKFLGGSVDLKKTDDGLAVVTLNHEAKKNAISGKMMVDLLHVVEELESWEEGKGMILRGAGDNFCSGGDLDFVKQIATPEEGFMMSTFMQTVLQRLQNLPLISAAMIDGIGALGGGAELSLACDYRLIDDECRGIGFVHAKLGIIPAWGGATRLVRKIGYPDALDILSTARILSPWECLRVGLVDEVIPSEKNPMEYVTDWLREKTQFEAAVVRGIKMVCSNTRECRDNCYEVERRIFAPFWGSPRNKQALSKNIKHNESVDKATNTD